MSGGFICCDDIVAVVGLSGDVADLVGVAVLWTSHSQSSFKL